MNRDDQPPEDRTFIYLLWHTNKETDDDKLLGVFDYEATAQAAIGKTYQSLPGFRDNLEGFEIARYEINKLKWTEGYVTVYPDE